MKRTIKRIIIIVSLLAMLIILILAIRHPEVQWRASVIKLKLSGDLPPDLTWKTLYKGSTNSLTALSYKCLVTEGPVIYQGFEIDGDGICSTLWDTPVGSLRSDCRDFCSLRFLLEEQLEEKIYDRYDSARVKPGDVVIDVGAHFGTFTRFALERGARLVIAFEPDTYNMIYFKKNFEKEIRSKKVILIEAAAWDAPGTLNFGRRSGTAASIVKETGDIIVPAVRIDDIIKRLELDHVDFIKMDIEGAERHAVAGLSKTISRFRPKMALCTYHLPDDPEVISSLVFDAHHDYKILQTKKVAFFFDETERRLD